MWVYEDSQAALRDALRLSRAMTYKAAVADLALGGGKGVIMIPPNLKLGRDRRQAALLDFADTVDAVDGRYVTAEDVGTSSRDMNLIATRTKHVAGLSRQRGGSGDPSPMTALGVYIAIQTCCERVFGSSSLKGRTISLLGLGHVGERVARRCARAGAKLIVADVNEARRPAAERLGARWTSPEKALEADVDVLSPCALGGILNDESVPQLRCRIVAGAANNQLATDAIADLLARRGILWAPDFVANAGGVINIAEEFGGYDPTAARRRVRGIADTLSQIFDDAGSIGATPLTAALELARKRLFAASDPTDGRSI
jgi:leucine dehydrogenase